MNIEGLFFLLTFCGHFIILCAEYGKFEIERVAIPVKENVDPCPLTPTSVNTRSPPAHYDSSFAWLDNDIMIAFGGLKGLQCSTGTWVESYVDTSIFYDISNNEEVMWYWKDEINKPPALYMPGLHSPEGSMDAYLYGGYMAGYFNHVWMYNYTENTWIQIRSSDCGGYNFGQKGVESASTLPWCGSVATSSSISTSFYVFGGYISSAFGTNVLWEYQMKNDIFLWRGGTTTDGHAGSSGMLGEFDENYSPEGRLFSNSWIFGNHFYIFGGRCYQICCTIMEFCKDLWAFDLQTDEFGWIGGELGRSISDPSTETLPGARDLAFVSQFGNFVYLFGGETACCSPRDQSNELWFLDLYTLNFTFVAGDKGVWNVISSDPDNYPSSLGENSHSDSYQSFSQGLVSKSSSIDPNSDRALYRFWINLWNCSEINIFDPEVCSGHGQCVGVDTCECDENYFGTNCELFECFGYLNNESDVVCSGHGTCVSIDSCKCDIFFDLVLNCSVSYYEELIWRLYDMILRVNITTELLFESTENGLENLGFQISDQVLELTDNIDNVNKTINERMENELWSLTLTFEESLCDLNTSIVISLNNNIENRYNDCMSECNEKMNTCTDMIISTNKTQTQRTNDEISLLRNELTVVIFEEQNEVIQIIFGVNSTLERKIDLLNSSLDSQVLWLHDLIIVTNSSNHHSLEFLAGEVHDVFEFAEIGIMSLNDTINFYRDQQNQSNVQFEEKISNLQYELQILNLSIQSHVEDEISSLEVIIDNLNDTTLIILSNSIDSVIQIITEINSTLERKTDLLNTTFESKVGRLHELIVETNSSNHRSFESLASEVHDVFDFAEIGICTLNETINFYKDQQLQSNLHFDEEISNLQYEMVILNHSIHSYVEDEIESLQETIDKLNDTTHRILSNSIDSAREEFECDLFDLNNSIVSGLLQERMYVEELSENIFITIEAEVSSLNNSLYIQIRSLNDTRNKIVENEVSRLTDSIEELNDDIQNLNLSSIKDHKDISEMMNELNRTLSNQIHEIELKYDSAHQEMGEKMDELEAQLLSSVEYLEIEIDNLRSELEETKNRTYENEERWRSTNSELESIRSDFNDDEEDSVALMNSETQINEYLALVISTLGLCLVVVLLAICIVIVCCCSCCCCMLFCVSLKSFYSGKNSSEIEDFTEDLVDFELEEEKPVERDSSKSDESFKSSSGEGESDSSKSDESFKSSSGEGESDDQEEDNSENGRKLKEEPQGKNDSSDTEVVFDENQESDCESD